MLDNGAWAPLAILASSGIVGIVIFFLAEEQQSWRTTLNILGAVVKLLLVGVITWGFVNGHEYEARFAFVLDFDLVLRVDALSLLFVSLSATLWLLTTIYAIGYLEGSPHRSRFFGFFSLCVTATMGIAFAGNLITFVLFYEMLTITTYPLVVHRGTDAALTAGRTYLMYTLGGGMALLIGVVWLHTIAGPVEFEAGGVLQELVNGNSWELRAIFALLVGGLGVKAALVPLHGWLPTAMVAPAPVSALLHAVAVVKAGAYGIIRVVHYTYGSEFADSLSLLLPLAVVASITIVFGSLRALAQQDMKRRLAFSTVSQLSYITLGVAVVGPIAAIGALVHLVHQGVMKVTLFFCAGNLAETLGIHSVSELDGVARRMPVTMTAFTVGGLGMIGLPPIAGFISKWHLGLGALDVGEPWIIAILATSSLLNAAYFLPPIYAAWFKPPREDFAPSEGRLETSWMLLIPAVATATISLLAGVLAGMPYSPLDLARLVSETVYPS
jgi:multicomponent Na+:H+ antiporter subunit D